MANCELCTNICKLLTADRNGSLAFASEFISVPGYSSFFNLQVLSLSLSFSTRRFLSQRPDLVIDYALVVLDLETVISR